jgi:N-acetylglucosaminyldiphosphoundecaprenol N-acetyl-beta-D-mannosaminyltransferase
MSTARTTTKVLGLPIEAANTEKALAWIAEDLAEKRKGYVCFVSVHGVMEAHRDASLAKVFAEAALCLPDGAPVAWVGQWQGEGEMQRVAGPEFMLEMFGDERFRDATHFLYGGNEGVADLLREKLEQRFPHTKIVGTYTPPFRDLSEAEEEGLVATIHRLKPDMLWVGIGCPKQERFMHRYGNRLDATLMFGVGAAFDVHTGRIQDSPAWIKRAGLQWLHRLVQDPRRLWKRYLRNNTAFVWHLALQKLGLEEAMKLSPPMNAVKIPREQVSR